MCYYMYHKDKNAISSIKDMYIYIIYSEMQ